MKYNFRSKYSNCQVTLRPSVAAEPLTGRSAVSGLHVRFKDGIAILDDSIPREKEMLKLLMQKQNFGVDFILLDDGGVDPFADNRQPVEPEHDITEIKHGAVGRSLNPKPKTVFTSEQKAFMKEQIAKEATILAKEIAKEIVSQQSVAEPAEVYPSVDIAESDKAPQPIGENSPPQPVETVETATQPKTKSKVTGKTTSKK